MFAVWNEFVVSIVVRQTTADLSSLRPSPYDSDPMHIIRLGLSVSLL